MIVEDHKNAIWSRLDALQYGEDVPVVVIEQQPHGYGGQLARRIVGLRIGLALGRKAVFPSDADPPYVQSLIRPFLWDTGQPFLWDTGQLGAGDPLVELFENDARPIVVFQIFRSRKELTFNLPKIQRLIEQRLAAAFRLNDDDLLKVDGWIFAWLRFLPEFEQRFECDKLKLGVSERTLGVHLRRGDKRIESAYVPASIFNEAVRGIHKVWDFDALFVASDNAEAPDELDLPFGVKLIFDRSEKRYNNANHKMLLANPSLAREETYVAFKNLRLLAACGGVVGQDNAHFATIAASYILQRDANPDRVVLLDGWTAEKHSASLRLFYEVKRRTREFARRLVPRESLNFVGKLTHRH